MQILRPDENTDAEVVTSGRDQLSITGGRLLDFFGAGLGEELATLPKGENFVVLHLSTASGENLSGEALVRAAETSVEKIGSALQRLVINASLARDYFLLGGIQVPRDIALLLDSTDDDGTVAAFSDELKARRLPFSRLANSSALGDCAVVPLSDEGLLADCIAFSDGLLKSPSAATVVVGASQGNGLGPDIRMRFGLLEPKAAERFDRLTLDESDRVMRIGVQDVASPAARARLLRRLEDGQNLGLVRLHDVSGLRDQVMASDQVIRRYWSMRRRRLSDPPVAGQPDAAERGRLMQDAALAWSYFERHVYSATGLAAGTVSAAPGGRVNSEVTLWDVASQINAVMAAADLGLIDRSVATDMIMKAVVAVPTNSIDGGVLPPSNFSAQTLKSTVAGFDSCDAGRFGIALASAVAKGFVAQADVLAVVKPWTFDRAIRAGSHFSNRSGIWQDTSQSHCTDYIGPGFAFLGQTLLPLYTSPDNSAETEIATLYLAASLGAISTEPFALQAIEGGMDRPTRVILDALFDAQLGWFEATGQLRCVSEIPIDRAPWFLYSGLQLDLEGPEAWVIGTITNEATSTELRSASEIISSKAAYLWRAVHPHAYSDRLVEVVRNQARVPGHGFAVGVYSDTLKPVPNYTDINTNGIILSAIAHILQSGQVGKN